MMDLSVRDPLLDALLREAAAKIAPPWVMIMRETAKHYRITVKDITGKGIACHVLAARHEATWRIRQETGLSLPAIAEKMGGRDHTSVLNSIRKHQARLDAEAAAQGGGAA